MAGAGFKTFNTGDVLTASDVNTYLMQQTVMVFDDAAARTTALTGVVAEGMMSYLKDTNKTYRYDGSSWLDDAGTTSPLTTKGDVWGYSTTDARIPVGADGTVLTADSAETLGVKWAAVASGGGLTLLETLSLSGATTTSATLSSSYKNLLIVVKGVYLAGNGTVYLRMNTDTGNNYSYAQARYQASSVSLNTGFLTNVIELMDLGNNSTATQNGYGVINIYRYNDTDIINCDFNFSGYIAGALRNTSGTAYYDNSAAISTVSLTTGSTFSAGTAYIYGVA